MNGTKSAGVTDKCWNPDARIPGFGLDLRERQFEACEQRLRLIKFAAAGKYRNAIDDSFFDSHKIVPSSAATASLAPKEVATALGPHFHLAPCECGDRVMNVTFLSLWAAVGD